MRGGVLVLSVSVLLVAAGCSSQSRSPEFRPTSTVKDIMDSVVDPAADALWDSVEVVATLEGTEHKAPKTDDDWKVLRQHAIALVEASNLLLIPGRHVAKPGEKADDARVDLHPEEIEAARRRSGGLGIARPHAPGRRDRIAEGDRRARRHRPDEFR